jgi:hypothetical protein
MLETFETLLFTPDGCYGEIVPLRRPLTAILDSVAATVPKSLRSIAQHPDFNGEPSYSAVPC